MSSKIYVLLPIFLHMNVIEVDHLFFSYQGSYVLKNLCFLIAEGEFIGIIGPNGGGKTTLLNLLMGFLRPEKGKIKIFGKSPNEACREIGWVPQNFHFDHQFPISVLEVVLTGRIYNTTWYGRYQKEDLQAARESLEKVGMLSFEKAKFAELSGGQKQRVLFARALARSPRLLLLDEPTASVDLNAQKDIYNLLASLKGTMTIIMVTHDLKAIIDYVEKVFCVEGELTTLAPEAVCSHFALGLYHSPLKTTEI